MENLQYPIGRFSFDIAVFESEYHSRIEDIQKLPDQIKSVLEKLDEKKLNKHYRPGGWTIRQVVHHLADSHSQCLTRLKWTLTEKEPIIKAYHEALWAELKDTRSLPVRPSLLILEGVHEKIVFLFNNLKEEDWNKTFYHPEKNRLVTLKETLFLYAWHGKHHLTHITNALQNIQ